MRLKKLERERGLLQKLSLWNVRLRRDGPALDVTRMMQYRPELFGKQYNASEKRAMLGPSEWSVGERQLFAAFVSRLNRCAFWTETHGAGASKAFGDDKLVKEVLNDWRSAAVDERLRAMLGFLEKLTLSPRDVGPEDVAVLGMAGVSYLACDDAIFVAALCNIADRIADALDFEVPRPQRFSQKAAIL